MLIDTHAHLNFNAFKSDLDEIIKKTLAEDIWVINIGSKYETSKRAVEIAEKYEKGVYAAIGLHPIYSATELVKIKTDPEEGDFTVREEDFDRGKYKELAKSEKVVAVGEDWIVQRKTKGSFIKSIRIGQRIGSPRDFSLPNGSRRFASNFEITNPN